MRRLLLILAILCSTASSQLLTGSYRHTRMGHIPTGSGATFQVNSTLCPPPGTCHAYYTVTSITILTPGSGYSTGVSGALVGHIFGVEGTNVLSITLGGGGAITGIGPDAGAQWNSPPIFVLSR